MGQQCQNAHSFFAAALAVVGLRVQGLDSFAKLCNCHRMRQRRGGSGRSGCRRRWRRGCGRSSAPPSPPGWPSAAPQCKPGTWCETPRTVTCCESAASADAPAHRSELGLQVAVPAQHVFVLHLTSYIISITFYHDILRTLDFHVACCILHIANCI